MTVSTLKKDTLIFKAALFSVGYTFKTFHRSLVVLVLSKLLSKISVQRFNLNFHALNANLHIAEKRQF